MGASKFAWTDGGAQSFTCDVHVQLQTPHQHRWKKKTRSLDGTVLEVTTVGSGINEVVCAIRHDNDDTGLRDLQDALDRGLEMTFTPNLDAPGTTYTVKAVGEVAPVTLEEEGQQNLWSIPYVRLARLDGGAFAPDHL